MRTGRELVRATRPFTAENRPLSWWYLISTFALLVGSWGATLLAPLPMHWFTANIGYHHVHHINARIPFYRLPEAMAALPELQSPRVTTLHPTDILACLRLGLWDPELGRMVSFAEASR